LAVARLNRRSPSEINCWASPGDAHAADHQAKQDCSVLLDGGFPLDVPLLIVKTVKNRRRPGRTRISAKNQATIPVAALRRAGLGPGDELRVEAAGAGRIVLTRVAEPVAGYAGRLTGVYPKGALQKLRREWR